MLERTGLFAESWNIAWRRRKETETLLSDKDTEFMIKNNSFKYWAADPFLFEYKGEVYIFAELYDYIHSRGSIGYCKWNGKKFGKWKQIILESYHLSYPYVFEKNGQVYIMPESGADKTLYLYHAVNFPNQWEKGESLRENVVYGDTTPFMWKEHNYALTYDVKDENKYELVLLDMEDSKNDYTLADINNINMRRPAGKMLKIGEAYVRPAQKCVDDYGEGLIFYKCKCEQGRYSEEDIEMILPQELKYSKMILLDGMHTYNISNHFEVIDLKTRRFNILNFIFRIIGKIRR